MEIEQVVQKDASLKNQIEALRTELDAINTVLAKAATFKPGSKTGHLVAGGFKVSVSLRDNVKWFQDRLNQVRELLPEAFNSAFIPEYKPASVKALTAACKDENFAKAVEWSREVTPGKPTTTYELLEDQPGDYPPF